MLLLVPALIAGILAVSRGGSLRNLAELPLRSSGLILASLAIQVLIYFPALRHSSLVLNHAGAIYVGALCLAMVGMLRNRHLGPTLQLATLGLLFNATVIAANGGHMPVNADALRATQGNGAVIAAQDPHTYGNTRLAKGSDHLLFLSDVIPVRLGDAGNVYSIGDTLISSGVALLVYGAVRRRPAASRRAAPPEQATAA
ncbi:MAG: DUF5317 domain-containing protein [Chloroflexota bacterium]